MTDFPSSVLFGGNDKENLNAMMEGGEWSSVEKWKKVIKVAEMVEMLETMKEAEIVVKASKSVNVLICDSAIYAC